MCCYLLFGSSETNSGSSCEQELEVKGERGAREDCTRKHSTPYEVPPWKRCGSVTRCVRLSSPAATSGEGSVDWGQEMIDPNGAANYMSESKFLKLC
jgi:hypothetical protein